MFSFIMHIYHFAFKFFLFLFFVYNAYILPYIINGNQCILYIIFICIFIYFIFVYSLGVK